MAYRHFYKDILKRLRENIRCKRVHPVYNAITSEKKTTSRGLFMPPPPDHRIRGDGGELLILQETPHHETNTSNHNNQNIAEQLEICQNTITMETVLCDGDITICEELGEPENICKQPLNVGHCRLYYERWFFDYTTKFCEPFTYSGCGGNENNFPNRTECVKYCTDITRVVHAPPPPDHRIVPHVLSSFFLFLRFILYGKMK
ncbi:hypothetical protein ACJJTC_017824 [Scirpophaga incertulas]